MKKKNIFKFKSVTCKLLSTIFLSVCIVFSICVYHSFAEVPCKINYQGRLIQDNVPVDGTKTMRFSIYPDAIVGSPIWTSGDVSIEVHNGLFRYLIGSHGGDLSSIDWTAGETLYLEVKVDGETLTPREEISAYPYAINSHLLEGEAKEYFINTSGETQTKQGGLNIMGNVGIGTTSPTSKLDVGGAIKYSGPNTGTILYSGTSSTGTPIGDAFRIRYNTGFFGATGDALIIEKTDGNADNPDGGIAFVNTGQDGIEDTAIVIRGNGNVGIGTTSPAAKLQINTVHPNDAITIVDSDTNDQYAWRLDGSGNLIVRFRDESAGTNYFPFRILNDARTDALVIKGSNVGIGTTNPQEKLHVVGNVRASQFITGDLVFNKDDQPLWRMYEDEDGLYLESLLTGKKYEFMLREIPDQ